MRRGVLYLWALDAPSLEAADLETLRKTQRHATGSALHLTQALVSSKGEADVGFWLVTRRAQAIKVGSGGRIGSRKRRYGARQSHRLGASGTSIAGASTSMALGTESEVGALYEEISSRRRRGSGGVSRVPALCRPLDSKRAANRRTRHSQAPPAADATYLITGGLGGLGLAVAEWMVQHGARHLVLLGRSGPSEAARNTVRELERTGARIVVEQADVSNFGRMEKIFADIDANLPPLRGVVHSAGVLDDGILLRQDWRRFTQRHGAQSCRIVDSA